MESLNSKLLIFIPTYNQVDYVVETLTSVAENRPIGCRVLVTDDGSSDGTSEKVKELSEKFGFEFKLQKNQGLNATLNDALALAEEDGFFFGLGGDDRLCKGGLKIALNKVLLNPQLGGVYGRIKKINGKGADIGEMENDKVEGHIFDDLFLAKINIPYTFTMWRVRCLREVGGYPVNLKFEDLYIARSILEKYPIGYADAVLMEYRKHGGGMSTKALLMVQEAEKTNLLWRNHRLYPKVKAIAAGQAVFALAKDHKKETLKRIIPALMNPFNKLLWIGLIKLFGIDLVEIYRYLTRKKHHSANS